MRVLLIEDHELMWNGTRQVVERVVQSCGDAVLRFEAVRDIESSEALAGQGFDLVLLDYRLPGVSGIQALHRAKALFEGASICIVSGEGNAETIREALEADASGFIPKSYGEADMAAALSLVLKQKVYAPAEFLLSQEVVRQRQSDEVGSDELAQFLRTELSDRQRQVLALALKGLPNKTIARRLNIAEGTVKVHLSMVYKALGVPNRVGALCRVLEADAASALE